MNSLENEYECGDKEIQRTPTFQRSQNIQYHPTILFVACTFLLSNNVQGDILFYHIRYLFTCRFDSVFIV